MAPSFLTSALLPKKDPPPPSILRIDSRVGERNMSEHLLRNLRKICDKFSPAVDLELNAGSTD
jgi:hypothetical protein